MLRTIVHGVCVAVGGFGMALFLFLLLPFVQAITEPPTRDLELRSVDTADVPPPPPPIEEEEEQKPDKPEEAKPPELTESAPPLDLSQLELALNPGMGGGDGMAGDFAVKLPTAASSKSGEAATDELFSLSDLDQKPRVIYQPGPVLDAELRKKAPGTVHILFVVGIDGRVEEPRVQKSTDPIFDRPALAAVKQWKFEPGKRKGAAVRFRMRVPITFPAGQ
jgi:periplasmic protein TonB